MASFSFNEAAYPGINLRGYILKLLLSFFTKLYVFWGNIRKAFLMIKLSSEEDKNRFCLFFWRSVITLFVFIIPLSYLGLMYPYSFKIMFWNIMLLSSLLMHARICCWTIFYVANLVKRRKSPYESVSAGNFALRSRNTKMYWTKDKWRLTDIW